MRRACIVVLALMCACGTATPQTRTASTSPTAAQSPSPSPSAAQTLLPFGAPPFKCRLPITLFSGAVRSGAFIDFPSGAITADPASVEVNVIPKPGRELEDKSYALYFDEAYARWLPVNRNAVSPDGSHYAYIDEGVGGAGWDDLHVVDVKTAVDQQYAVGPADLHFVVVDYAAEGIYFRDRGSIGSDFFDPVKLEQHLAIDEGNYQGSAGNGFFWEGVTNPKDPNPVTANAADELDKVSRVDGSRVAWFYRPGTSVHFLTQDPKGHPIVVLSTAATNSEEFLYVSSAGVSREILHVGNGAPAISDPIADSHGVWFGAPDGIYLYTEKDGLRQVSRQGGIPANGCF